MKILIVDDDTDSADSISLLLAIQGHETRVADGGREALAVLRAFRPKLVICDIFMPSLNGLVFAQTVREMRDVDQPVLAAYSGMSRMDDQRAATDAGFDVFLPKPLDIKRLEKLVREVGIIA